MDKKNVFTCTLPKMILQFALILFCSGFFTSCAKDQPIEKTYILIYNGYLADADGVAKVAQMAEEKAYDVEFISNLSQLRNKLKGAFAFIIGGTSGNTGNLLGELNEGKDVIKKFITEGGSYMGICGGAYVASKGSQCPDGYETGMDLADCESFVFEPNYSDAQIITIKWHGTNRTIYYLNGPAFLENKLPANSKVLAYYTNANKDVVAFHTRLGNGNIVLCGLHPEADDTWLIDDPTPLNANQRSET